MADKKRDIHVVPNHQNGQLSWSVKREGAQRSSGNFSNKDDAMNAARQIAINNGLERFEHRKDGVIVRRDSYGNDPRKSKG
jgi:hypothetical protein